MGRFSSAAVIPSINPAGVAVWILGVSRDPFDWRMGPRAYDRLELRVVADRLTLYLGMT
jgi:hypothetical protein